MLGSGVSLTEKTRFTVVASSVERKKGTLLFKGKTESLVQKNTTQQEKGPCLFPAGDHGITRGEGDADGEGIKKITSGDNKGVQKCVLLTTEPSRPNAQPTTKGFRSTRGQRSHRMSL